MLALIGNIISAVVFGHIMKLASHRHANLLWVGAWNYLTASAICLGLTIQSPPHAAIGFTIATGGWAGVCYLISLLYYFAAVARLGMSLATAAIRISVAMPVLAALLVWHERLHPAQAAGLLLVGVALLGLTADGGSGAGRPRNAGRTANLGNAEALLPVPPRARSVGYAELCATGQRDGRPGHRIDPRILLGLILPLFLVTGGGQLAARIFSGGAPAADAALYSAAVFAAAALSAFVALAIRPAPLRREDILLGILLGACNATTNLLLLRVLRELPSSVVFSISSAASVALAAVTGALVWGERPGKPAIGAILAATAAVALLAR